MKHLTKIIFVILLAVCMWPDTTHAACTVTYGNHTMTSNGYMVTGVYRFPGHVRNGQRYDITLNTYGDSRNNAQYTVYNTCWSETQMNNTADWAFWTFVDEFFAQNNNTWTHNPGCGNTHTFTRTLIQEPRNGVCSAARNTCSVGTSAAQSETDSRYTWSCAGLHGGTTAQCSLDKGGRNGNGGNNNGRDTVVTIDPEFDPYCKSSDRRALIGADDSIIFSAVDKNGHSPAGYVFNWLKTSVLAQADLSGGGAAAATLQSSDALVFNQGDVSFTVSAPGMQTQTEQCPGGEFMDFKFGFVKPIVDEAAGESCRLYWDEFEADTTCKVFSQQGQQVGGTVLTGETFREVPANNTYQLKCETMGMDADNLVAVVGEFETPYVSCIRKGNLSEI